MRKTFLILIITAISLVIVNAQFNFKSVKNNSLEVGNSVSKMSSGNFVINDAETKFTLSAVMVNHKDVGWNLDSNLTAVGDIPSRSAARIVVKKNGKELYMHRCEFRSSTYTKNRTDPCSDRKKVIPEIGVMNVEIYLINGDTDEEILYRTYKIDVHRATKADDGRPDYYIQRHGDAAVAYLTIDNKGELLVQTFFSPVEDAQNKFGASPFLRCSVNGQNLDLLETYVVFGHGGVSSATLTGRRKDRSFYKEAIRFDIASLILPLNLKGNSNRTYDVAKNPGKWECKIVSNVDRTIFRTIRFEVTGNGSIVPHPEQRNGNVNLGENQIMIEIEIPAGGSSIDGRLLPQPEMGFLLGIAWTTPEGKAAAAKVPKKGNPYPVPQN